MPITFLIIKLVQKNSWIAEYVFAQGIYRWISIVFSKISGFFFFSIMEVSIYLAVILGILFIIFFTWRFLYRNERYKIEFIWKAALNISCILSIYFFLYVILAGTNYYRYPFSEFTNLEVQDSTIDELYELNMHLTKQASELREELSQIRREDKEFEVASKELLQLSSMSWGEMVEEADRAFTNLSSHYPVFEGSYGLPKPVYYSKFMSKMEITGIFWPFTLEANINIDVPAYTIPVTMAHEMAHLRGFMREDEANYIGYLACMQSEHLEFQYSGVMLALTYAGSALYRADPLLYQDIRNLFHEGMIADLNDSASYWSQFNNTVISTVSNKMNDTYLKVNNQKDGIQSYGRMVDLLLAEYRSNHIY